MFVQFFWCLVQIGFPSVPFPLRQLPFDRLGQWWTVDFFTIPMFLYVTFFGLVFP